MLLSTLLLVSAAHAEDAPPAEPIPFGPERPGFAEGTGMAPSGHLMLETGVGASFGEASTGLLLPELALRFGLLEWLELRAYSAWLLAAPEEGNTLVGLGDTQLGVKLFHALGPVDTALVGVAGLPTGTGDFDSEGVDGRFALNLGLALTDTLGLGANGGFEIRDDGGDSLDVPGFASLALSATFGDLGVFGQCVANFPDGGDLQPAAAGGLWYGLTPTAQIDLWYLQGLGSDGDDPFISLGFSIVPGA